MARWQLLAGPNGEAPDVQLTKAMGRSITWRLLEPSELSFRIDGRHPQAGYLQELVTDVHLVRDRVPVYTGRVGGGDDSVADDRHQLKVSTADTRAMLDRRMWPTEPGTQYDGDSGALARLLLDTTQGQPGGDLAIATDQVADTGTTISRELKGGASILGELQAAAAHGRPDAGFEWDVTPGWQDRQLQLWAPQRGEDRGVVLDYVHTGKPRASIVADVQRSLQPADYANAVRVVGGVRVEKRLIELTNADGSTSTEEIEVRHPTTPAVRSIAADGPEGLWESRITDSSLVWQSQVDARADAEIARLGKVQPSYSVELSNGAWAGPDHIWLGDTVRLIARTGRLDVDEQLRVLEVQLELGEDGQERVELTVGRPVPTLLRHLHATERRLTLLER